MSATLVDPLKDLLLQGSIFFGVALLIAILVFAMIPILKKYLKNKKVFNWIYLISKIVLIALLLAAALILILKLPEFLNNVATTGNGDMYYYQYSFAMTAQQLYIIPIVILFILITIEGVWLTLNAVPEIVSVVKTKKEQKATKEQEVENLQNEKKSKGKRLKY